MKRRCAGAAAVVTWRARAESAPVFGFTAVRSVLFTHYRDRYTYSARALSRTPHAITTHARMPTVCGHGHGRRAMLRWPKRE